MEHSKGGSDNTSLPAVNMYDPGSHQADALKRPDKKSMAKQAGMLAQPDSARQPRPHQPIAVD
jgi:hypothetical protein